MIGEPSACTGGGWSSAGLRGARRQCLFHGCGLYIWPWGAGGRVSSAMACTIFTIQITEMDIKRCSNDLLCMICVSLGLISAIRMLGSNFTDLKL